MKKIVTILLLSLLTNILLAQPVNGYVTEVGEFSDRDSSYNTTVLSGVSIDFRLMEANDGEIQVLRLGYVTPFGVMYSDYLIREYFMAKTEDEWSIYLCVNYYEEQIALKFTDNDFFLLYQYYSKYGVSGVWRRYYKGIILNNKLKYEKDN